MNRYQEVKKQLRADTKTWLITGCAGFIGSNLLEKLLKLNQRVVGLDNFMTGKQANLDEVQVLVTPEQWLSFTFINGDIRDRDTCEQAVNGVDYVLHQAALGSVPRSINDPFTTNSCNVTGFLNMLDAARRAGVRRFVYASSSSVYGDHPDLPKVEEQIGKPLSPYALTKAINEQYAAVFANAYGFDSIGLRYFNVFGARQDPDGAYAAVIPKWLAKLIKGEPVEVYGDGETSRDFCYVGNAVQANILAAMAPNSASNKAYNVAFGERTTLNELLNLLSQELTACSGQKEFQKAVYKPERAGDVRHSLANITMGRNCLGYIPTHSINKGLKNTMHWYLNMLKPSVLKS